MHYRIQSILFPRKTYTIESVISWIIRHGYSIKKIDTTIKHYRVRQFTPKKGAKYRTHKLPNSKGIEFILELNY